MGKWCIISIKKIVQWNRINNTDKNIQISRDHIWIKYLNILVKVNYKWLQKKQEKEKCYSDQMI